MWVSHAGRGSAELLPGADRRGRYTNARVDLVTKDVLVIEMRSLGQVGAHLTVVAGHTYRETSEVFNRCLMPVYQTSHRWTGNRLDAEDVTARVIVNEFGRLDLPRTVMAVDEQLGRGPRQALGGWIWRSAAEVVGLP